MGNVSECCCGTGNDKFTTIEGDYKRGKFANREETLSYYLRDGNITPAKPLKQIRFN